MTSVMGNPSEWSLPDPSVEVRQGDCLISRSLRTGLVDEIFLVITADCDISKGKFGRQLMCLRVVPLSEYVKSAWASKKLERLGVNERTKLRGQIAKWHTRLLGAESSLTPEAVVSWVMREEPEAMCTQLQVPESDRKKVVASLKNFRDANLELARTSASDPLTQYVAYRSVVRSQEMSQCRQEVLQEAQRESESLPEDVFLLTSLPQISDGGAVVLLREVVGVPYEAVCYRATDAVQETCLLRIGRLHPTFKYAISQAFGALYSRIGLPSDYEERCKEVVAGIPNIKWE